jgi:hypothetical protein
VRGAVIVPTSLDGRFAPKLTGRIDDKPGLAVGSDGIAPFDTAMPRLAREAQAPLAIADEKEAGREADGVIVAGGDILQ